MVANGFSDCTLSLSFSADLTKKLLNPTKSIPGQKVATGHSASMSHMMRAGLTTDNPRGPSTCVEQNHIHNCQASDSRDHMAS